MVANLYIILVFNTVGLDCLFLQPFLFFLNILDLLDGDNVADFHLYFNFVNNNCITEYVQ